MCSILGALHTRCLDSLILMTLGIMGEVGKVALIADMGTNM